MTYSAAVKAQQDGATVRVGTLVEFRFLSSTVRVWDGFGTITTLDGRVWLGAAGLGSIDGIAQALDGEAPALVLTLSGIDATFYTIAQGERAEYYNRLLIVYDQYFNLDMSCRDNPYSIGMGRMATLTSDMVSTEDGREYSIELTAENPFTGRRRPRYGWVTPRDQKLRVGEDDTGCDRTPGIDNKFIEFPVF
jgi:hypothetical protein